MIGIVKLSMVVICPAEDSQQAEEVCEYLAYTIYSQAKLEASGALFEVEDDYFD